MEGRREGGRESSQLMTAPCISRLHRGAGACRTQTACRSPRGRAPATAPSSDHTRIHAAALRGEGGGSDVTDAVYAARGLCLATNPGVRVKAGKGGEEL